MPERTTRQPEPSPGRKHSDEEGPSSPKQERPTKPNPLAERLKKVDPDQAKKYRQRSGE
ncbi:MAG: ubiquitin-like protein UBact [Chthonomonas sp.]|nr:ubiquitin-like protein UBact [Chthonomonas sp.]